MMDVFRFRPRKNSPAAYFNNGAFSYWVQADNGTADPHLIEAIEAALKAFNVVWLRKPPAASAEAPGEDVAAQSASPLGI